MENMLYSKLSYMCDRTVVVIVVIQNNPNKYIDGTTFNYDLHEYKQFN